LNPETRAFSPIPRLSTQVGEKSLVQGFHAAMVAGAPPPVSSELAGCGVNAAADAGAASGLGCRAPARAAGSLTVNPYRRVPVQ
jgi:hypothetical protein